MGAPEISAFLTWLAVGKRVSASTQNQALSAVLFLYRRVLETEVGQIEQVPRARAPVRVPVVLSRNEVKKVLDHLTGTMRIIAVLLYGAGLRLQDCLEGRIKDIDFDRHQIVLRRAERLVPALIEGTHPAMAALREQYRRSHIKEVELTGAGFYMDFEVPLDAPRAVPANFAGGHAKIILKGVDCEAGCVLFVRDGRLSTLEGYTYDKPWPEEIDAVLAVENVTPLSPE
jgi:hypothetical protein